MWIEIEIEKMNEENIGVTPFAGVWIEIYEWTAPLEFDLVTPFAGVWIEMIRL